VAKSDKKKRQPKPVTQKSAAATKSPPKKRQSKAVGTLVKIQINVDPKNVNPPISSDDVFVSLHIRQASPANGNIIYIDDSLSSEISVEPWKFTYSIMSTDRYYEKKLVAEVSVQPQKEGHPQHHLVASVPFVPKNVTTVNLKPKPRTPPSVRTNMSFTVHAQDTGGSPILGVSVTVTGQVLRSGSTNASGDYGPKVLADSYYTVVATYLSQTQTHIVYVSLDNDHDTFVFSV
jgi:hypothetical protein